jgi:hypothetical protein
VALRGVRLFVARVVGQTVVGPALGGVHETRVEASDRVDVQVLDEQARHGSRVRHGVEVHRLGVDDDDVLAGVGPARCCQRIDGVEAGVAVLAIVQRLGALGELEGVGGDATRQVDVATLADDLIAVGHLTFEHVELGVGVVDARAAAPVGVEVDAQRRRTVFLVDRHATLAGAAFAADQFGAVPDVVILVNQLDMGSHDGSSRPWGSGAPRRWLPEP